MLTLGFGFGGPWDMAILLVIVLVLFGGAKIAGLAKSVGEGIREFKKATRDDEEIAGPPNTKTPVIPDVSATTPPAVVSRTEEK